jgi:hypothetical protein
MIEISTLPNRKRFQAARQDDGGICVEPGHANSDECSALSSCCPADLKHSIVGSGTGSIIHFAPIGIKTTSAGSVSYWRSGLMRFSLIAVLLS